MNVTVQDVAVAINSSLNSETLVNLLLLKVRVKAPVNDGVIKSCSVAEVPAVILYARIYVFHTTSPVSA